MEHSALHATQLTGLILVLSGPLFILGFVNVTSRQLALSAATRAFAAALTNRAGTWVFYGALAATVANGLDLFVQTAELTGRTIFAGVDLDLLVRFLLETETGRLALIRTLLLGVTAVLAYRAGAVRWWLVSCLGLLTVFTTSLVSHAAAQPSGRNLAIVSQILHLGGAAAWLGVLMHLLVARRLIESADDPERLRLTAGLVRRFSPVALGAASILLISGLFAAVRFVRDLGAVVSSAYGLTLVVKLSLLSLVVWAGSRNFRVVRPALIRVTETEPASAPLRSPLDAASRKAVLVKFGRMLELEVSAGLLVIAVAGIVASVPPPAGPGKQQLTQDQSRALLSPHWPRSMFQVNPKSFYGAPERTMDDLRYAEFTHNWSGVLVIALGCCWLLQSTNARWGGVAARLWPWLLVLFGILISALSDPEIWILRAVSVRQVLIDPQLLEHQLGAVMVFLLAWFAWRDRLRTPETRPLGYVLPAIMIVGSLLLLGHAHSNLNTGDELASLVNVQHAVMGAFGLFGGTARWLTLRRLIPERVGAWLWPSMVIGLGILMAFFYRETL